MPEQDSGWFPATVNAVLAKKLDEHVSDIKTKGLPHSTRADILNSLLLEYLLQVYKDDAELKEIERIVKEKGTTVHKAAVQVYINRHGQRKS